MFLKSFKNQPFFGENTTGIKISHMVLGSKSTQDTVQQMCGKMKGESDEQVKRKGSAKDHLKNLGKPLYLSN